MPASVYSVYRARWIDDLKRIPQPPSLESGDCSKKVIMMFSGSEIKNGWWRKGKTGGWAGWQNASGLRSREAGGPTLPRGTPISLLCLSAPLLPSVSIQDTKQVVDGLVFSAVIVKSLLEEFFSGTLISFILASPSVCYKSTINYLKQGCSHFKCQHSSLKVGFLTCHLLFPVLTGEWNDPIFYLGG